ncbi:hypothetical protein Pcinc_009855 [Petrolisthes cinctipes]|uniref:Uncharacterized protein n=1 Tax=Petrolisthes cinctipes TaxID=88211 RepID=A0AAE1G5Y8_PETCI|nr:hypothetical protein Pcinc_009855 [Petrolisthes cinctipes]
MAPHSTDPGGALMPPPRPPDLHTPTTGVKVRTAERQLETSNKVLATPLVASELSQKKPPSNFRKGFFPLLTAREHVSSGSPTAGARHLALLSKC